MVKTESEVAEAARKIPVPLEEGRGEARALTLPGIVPTFRPA